MSEIHNPLAGFLQLNIYKLTKASITKVIELKKKNNEENFSGQEFFRVEMPKVLIEKESAKLFYQVS